MANLAHMLIEWITFAILNLEKHDTTRSGTSFRFISVQYGLPNAQVNKPRSITLQVLLGEVNGQE